MSWRGSRAAKVLAALACPLVFAATAHAHSASDAYLTLAASPGAASAGATLDGQWDIALRDLDFVLKLDADGDGRITWGEVRTRRVEIDRFAYAGLRATRGEAPCTVRPLDQKITDHADGAYVALFFRLECAPGAPALTLDYRLFFDVDPTHRGILVFRSGTTIATSLLAPDNARVKLDIARAK